MPNLAFRSVWIFASPGSAPLDVTGPLDVFRRANAYSKGGKYDVLLVGARDRTVMTESGIGLVAQATLAEAVQRGLPHTVIVGGGNPELPDDSDETVFVRWLQRHAAHIPRICSVCSGAFLLGAAGLLTSRRATTHWSLLDSLQRRFPQTQVVNDALFVTDEKIWTSAGVTSGIDLSLAIVEEDLGYEVSLAVARFLVLFLRRSGSQQQYSSTLAAQSTERRNLRDLQAYIFSNLNEDLSIEKLADVCCMSPRNLARVFKKEIGRTLGAFIRNVRLDEARRLLENSDLSLSEVAAKVGGGDESTLRRWFIDQFGVSPTQYRERFRVRRLA